MLLESLTYFEVHHSLKTTRVYNIRSLHLPSREAVSVKTVILTLFFISLQETIISYLRFYADVKQREYSAISWPTNFVYFIRRPVSSVAALAVLYGIMGAFCRECSLESSQDNRCRSSDVCNHHTAVSTGAQGGLGRDTYRLAFVLERLRRALTRCPPTDREPGAATASKCHRPLARERNYEAKWRSVWLV